MRLSKCFAIGVIGAASSLCGAEPPKADRAAIFVKLVDCRAIADSTSRLACYDRQVTALDDAATRKDVVVIDRNQIRETKKTLFGLSLPRLGIFGNDDGDDDVKEITKKVALVSTDREGRLIVQLEDGARWRQTDDLELGRLPKAGTLVVIKRAALTSYKMNVGGQPAIKVRREN